MSATSAIEWTATVHPDGTVTPGKTWNPVRGCSIVSEGCHNCYAMKQAHRFSGAGKPYHGLTKQTKAGPQWTGKVVTVESSLLEPLSWRKPSRVFVNSMSDLFHEDVPFDFVDKVWDVMWRTPRHTYQILTKRPERMVEYIRTRAGRRRFGWTDQSRHAMRPGEFIHLEDIRMRNMCGYVGDADWSCDHPTHGGAVDSCGEYECPIAVRVDERDKLRAIGVENDYRYGDDGFAEDSQWMELTDRPLHGAAGNVQLGFSAENQEQFTKRIGQFSALRWILGPHFTLFASLEPLLSAINFTVRLRGADPGIEFDALSRYDFSDGSGPCHQPYLDWVIVGGESGPGARPCALEWVQGVVDQCKAARVPAFVKQLGAFVVSEERTIPAADIGMSAADLKKYQAPNGEVWAWRAGLKDRKGGDVAEFPRELQVRQFPEARP